MKKNEHVAMCLWLKKLWRAAKAHALSLSCLCAPLFWGWLLLEESHIWSDAGSNKSSPRRSCGLLFKAPAREPLQNLSSCLHAFGRASFLLQYFHFMFLSFTPDSMESETVESMFDALRWWGIFQLAQVCDLAYSTVFWLPYRSHALTN